MKKKRFACENFPTPPSKNNGSSVSLAERLEHLERPRPKKSSHPLNPDIESPIRQIMSVINPFLPTPVVQTLDSAIQDLSGG